MAKSTARNLKYRFGPTRETYLKSQKKYRNSENGRAVIEAYRERAVALRRFYRRRDEIRSELKNGFTPEELAQDYRVPLDRILKLIQDEDL